MPRMTKIAVLVTAVLVAASGCATRDWTRELLGKKEVEIGQRIDGLSGQVTQTGEAVKVTRDRADSAMNKADSAMNRADGAMNRADAAMERADGVDNRVTRLWNNRYNQKVAGTVEVFFDFDKAELSDGAQTGLLSVVKELQTNPTLIVQLGGFTDPQGTKDYNYGLAQRRVEAVRRFLASQGVPMTRVTAVGLGPLDERGTPNDKKRRVTVTLQADSE